ncbi:pirin family protein [Acinetobacter baumannii]|uniref:pirin family protein n=1 Tax=Acinetobacter baumannii TaxID=470 RepID=UPI000DE7A479|nr:pirin family protein [Acinetobacter baumannii]EKT9381089.1 pirin family protein [Acinetobacter baumannii]EKU0759622.1 pirin family protein [Acinetobacter baumannii]EKV8393482.1 pirin family protein [Acinetobacter baumannii]EKW0729868.1 pirin family protein [Acinetobacter baumannii]EKW0739426.1 pirin family protein [Acinetobacter baumannii]
MKSLAFIHRNDTRFAVGDFYPVLSVFSYHELGNTLSPFLLLDHLGPGKIAPSMKRRGVNDHPHRGFETVTLIYAGELEHKDSSGGGGSISAGDVQWMTAGAGVIHRELFSEEFSKSGGTFEMIQLWVNLPAADKMNSPRYQSLKKAEIPVVKLENEAGFVRIIAGRFNHVIGPALTHTPITLLDIELRAGQQAGFPAQSGETTLVYLRSGRAQFQKDEEVLEEQGLAVMSNQGEHLSITALQSCKLLILTGQPITEPINGHGPFVMNTYDEILQAYDDIKNGRFAK